MALSSKERATLRAEAHKLTAAVHIGQHSVTGPVCETVDDALRTRELVKIQFTKNAALTVKEAATDLAKTLGADVVQVIGKTATLHRENPDLERKGGVPPWRTA
jgi:RNA-binding protein